MPPRIDSPAPDGPLHHQHRRRGADEFRARHEPRPHHQGAAAADRCRDRGGRHRPRVSLVLLPARDGGDRGHPPGDRGAAPKASAHRAGRALVEARRALRADRRAGHRAHGDGGLRRRLLGRARDGGRRAAGEIPRRRAAPRAGLQSLRARSDAGRTRSPTKPSSCCANGFRAIKLPARLSDARRRISRPCTR